MPRWMLLSLCAVMGGLGCTEDIVCVRAIECVVRCGGPVVASGCQCPDGTFDALTCVNADAGTDASGDR